MRIAFVVNNYPPRTGGVELHVQALAEELRRLGHEPLVVTLGATPGRGEQDGIEVLTLSEHFRVADILGFPSLGTGRRLSKLLVERGVDVVSVHTRFFPMSYVGFRAARRAGVPVIHTEHGSGHVASDSPLIRYASRLVDFTVGRAVLRGADTVLGVSEAVCAFVERLSGVRAELFYNAIQFDERAARAVRAAQPSPRPNHLVFVGRIVPGKGWEVLLDLVAARRAAGEPVTAEILGDGVDMPTMRSRIADLGLADGVRVRGRVSQQEVREALRGATLVNPTVLSEGFQTTLIEAIAEGGRVLTFPVPGAERLRAQGAPVMIAADRTLQAMEEAWLQLATAAPAPASPELVAEWSWERRAQQYVRVMNAAQAQRERR